MIMEKLQLLIKSKDRRKTITTQTLSIRSEELKSEIPDKRFEMIYMIMLLHGLELLLPWNMFLTAKSYFVDYKLNQNYRGASTNYGQYFMSYIAFAAQVPNVLVNWTNIFVSWELSVRSNVVWSLIVQIIVFCGNMFLFVTDSRRWPEVFLLLTIFGIVVMQLMNGLYQSSLFGFAAKLPQRYTGVIIIGTNVSGTFVALVSLCGDVLFPSQKSKTLFYFLIAIFMLLFCLNPFFFLPFKKFYRIYEEKLMEIIKDQPHEGSEKVPYLYIFKTTFPLLLNIFLTMFITMAIYPAIHTYIRPVDPIFIISPDLFTTVTCYLTFNLFGVLGSLLATTILLPKPKHLWILVSLRLIFIPLFLFCNYQSPGLQRSLPVLINNDWAYWFLSSLNGFLSGYLTSLSMMYIPGSVAKTHSSVASMFGSAMMVTGIFFGVIFSFSVPSIVSYNNSIFVKLWQNCPSNETGTLFIVNDELNLRIKKSWMNC